MTIETLGGSVHINRTADGNLTVQVIGAINSEHALSVASEALTNVGISGTWLGTLQDEDLGGGFWFALRPDDERTCEGFEPQ